MNDKAVRQQQQQQCSSSLRLLISDFPDHTGVLNSGGADQIVESDVSLSDKATLFRRGGKQTRRTAVGVYVRWMPDYSGLGRSVGRTDEKEKINLLHSSRGHPIGSTHKSDGEAVTEPIKAAEKGWRKGDSQ